MPITDWDKQIIAVDIETSGTEQAFALQPWRVPQKKAWITSIAWVRRVNGKFKTSSGLDPTPEDIRQKLRYAIDNDCYLLMWNAAFDLSFFVAYGCEDLVMRVKVIDGMLTWKHWFIEPESEVDRSKKKSYGLKQAVAEFLPQHAGYEEGVDFHDTSEEARKKLHKYNVRDNVFTYMIAEHIWSQLDEKQQRCVLIEAQSLPLVAQANFNGMLVDTVHAKALEARLTKYAEECLSELYEHVQHSPLITERPIKKLPTERDAVEAIVRSPTKLAIVLYDEWGLPVLKENKGKKTGKISRATNKEVLHELAFKDKRAKLIKEFREALNNRTKFATTPYLAADYNGDGRAHPLARVFGTYTGRMTYSSKQTGRSPKEDVSVQEEA
jgi:DNA polymerase I-like protein with 3'-5' exonuclease and polymerase domains